MPSIDDIANVAEALEKSPVIVVRDRCVAVRNRNSTCRRCVAACPSQAITLMPNDISLSASACSACGACVPACPTEALVASRPTEGQMREGAMRSVAANDGVAVIACARIASKRQVDPNRFAEVPCLSAVGEALLVELVARGAKRFLLVDGNCGTCKNRDCIEALYVAIGRADQLLGPHGADLDVSCVTGFPAGMRADDAAGLYGSTRRGFFSDALGAAKETAMTAAKTTLENELGYKVDEKSIGERMRVTEHGTLPQIDMPRHERVLNALDSIGLPESGPIESRMFASVAIDVKACNACGMCAVFCPTGALSRDPSEKASDPLRFLEFTAADCVQCGLCEDVCWKGALALSSTVDASELYDFEPRTFKVKQCKKKAPAR